MTRSPAGRAAATTTADTPPEAAEADCSGAAAYASCGFPAGPSSRSGTGTRRLAARLPCLLGPERRVRDEHRVPRRDHHHDRAVPPRRHGEQPYCRCAVSPRARPGTASRAARVNRVPCERGSARDLRLRHLDVLAPADPPVPVVRPFVGIDLLEADAVLLTRTPLGPDACSARAACGTPRHGVRSGPLGAGNVRYVIVFDHPVQHRVSYRTVQNGTRHMGRGSDVEQRPRRKTSAEQEP